MTIVGTFRKLPQPVLGPQKSEARPTIPHLTLLSPQVHMGTHMWSGGASRRGRRMSLELPPRPLHEPHDLLRRPDLFYPYLPAPFLNGMQQKVR